MSTSPFLAFFLFPFRFSPQVFFFPLLLFRFPRVFSPPTLKGEDLALVLLFRFFSFWNLCPSFPLSSFRRVLKVPLLSLPSQCSSCLSFLLPSLKFWLIRGAPFRFFFLVPLQVCSRSFSRFLCSDLRLSERGPRPRPSSPSPWRISGFSLPCCFCFFAFEVDARILFTLEVIASFRAAPQRNFPSPPSLCFEPASCSPVGFLVLSLKDCLSEALRSSWVLTLRRISAGILILLEKFSPLAPRDFWSSLICSQSALSGD